MEYATIILPILTAAWVVACPPRRGVINMGNATCYLSSVLQALTYVPSVCNLELKKWKAACGCSPHCHCWLCYPAVWIAGWRRPHVPKCERPEWALKRVHLLMDCARNFGRGCKAPKDVDQVRVCLFVWK